MFFPCLILLCLIVYSFFVVLIKHKYYINDDCMNEFNEHKAKIEEALSRVNVSIDVIGDLLGICLVH